MSSQPCERLFMIECTITVKKYQTKQNPKHMLLNKIGTCLIFISDRNTFGPNQFFKASNELKSFKDCTTSAGCKSLAQLKSLRTVTLKYTPSLVMDPKQKKCLWKFRNCYEMQHVYHDYSTDVLDTDRLHLITVYKYKTRIDIQPRL